MTAKVKIPLWKSAFFWDRIAEALIFIATLSLVGSKLEKWSDTITIVIGGSSITAQLLKIIFADKNKNNLVDLFEPQEADVEVHQEVNVTVKPGVDGGPPVVDVSQQTVETPKT
jgi:hypothetical protein